MTGKLKSEPRCRGRRSILPALEIERPSSLPLPWVSSVGLMPQCHGPGVLLGSHGASGRARAPYFKFDHDSAEMTKDERPLDDLCLRGAGAGDRSSFACRESAMIASGGEELRRRRTAAHKQTHKPPRSANRRHSLTAARMSHGTINRTAARIVCAQCFAWPRPQELRRRMKPPALR